MDYIPRKTRKMNITEKITVPLIESRYLSAENADRYRSIMRLFYLHYEKMRYWLIRKKFWELKAEPYLLDYTMEQCRQDLNALVGWRNLSTLQDTRNVKSIEAFKNKNFRYQMTEYSVEIERMVVRLENLFVEGASLEPALLDRLRIPDWKAGGDGCAGKWPGACLVEWSEPWLYAAEPELSGLYAGN